MRFAALALTLLFATGCGRDKAGDGPPLPVGALSFKAMNEATSPSVEHK